MIDKFLRDAQVSDKRFSAKENGKRQVGRERAKRLAEALQVSDYRIFL